VRRLFLFAAVALLLPAAASASVHIRAVDTATDFGRVRVTVVTSRPTTKAPTLLENGRPVQNATAINLGSSKSVVLAIDRSQSMGGKPLRTASVAAQAFVDTKPAADQIAVSTFASQATPPSPLSSSTIDADSVLRAITTADPHRGTRMYDDLLLDINALEHQDLAGRVIILVTDGNETTSTATLADVVSAARRASVSIYVVGVESQLYTPKPLRALASGTGGAFYPAASPGYLRQIYTGIADELRRTWQVDYLTAGRPGDTLAIKAAVPGQGDATTSALIAGSTTLQQSKSTIPKSFYSTRGTLVIALITGLLLALALRVLFRKSRTEEMRRRIQPHIGQEPQKIKRKRERPGVLRNLFASTENVLGKSKQWSSLSRLLERGDVPLKTVEFAYVILACGLFLGFVISVLGLHGIFLLIAFVLGAMAPIGFVWRKSRKRLAAFDEQLPDLLMAVAASLKAGHSFKQGIQTIVEEAQDPAKKEFQRVLAEASLGRPVEAALADMAERLGSKNFSFIVTAVTIQNQVGGSLAGLFDMVADTVRQRQQFQRKIKALTAMGRASAYVLIALPIFLAMLLTAVNHKYMRPLFFSSAGHTLIIIGLVAMSIGSVILRKIVSFKG